MYWLFKDNGLLSEIVHVVGQKKTLVHIDQSWTRKRLYSPILKKKKIELTHNEPDA